MSTKISGVSIVVCCHNSAERLPKTLSFLSSQNDSNTQWEVIIVDNGSRDETAQVAQDAWPAHSSVPLRVIFEPKLGLNHARQRGLQESRYEIVSFLDDDNWVGSDWVEIVAEAMQVHSEVGALGGQTEPVYEIDPPEWFERYKGNFAVGPQGEQAQDITWKRGFLWGAGLTIRKPAYEQILKEGFRFLLADRTGSNLSSGGDAEMCHALRMAGWCLWYEPRLKMKHFLPERRLKWSYLRRLHRGMGASQAGHDPYNFVFERNKGRFQDIQKSWKWKSVKTSLGIVKTLLHILGKMIWKFDFSLEGKHKVLILENQIGYLTELLSRRREYDQSLQKIYGAAWRKV